MRNRPFLDQGDPQVQGQVCAELILLEGDGAEKCRNSPRRKGTVSGGLPVSCEAPVLLSAVL